MSKIHLRRLSLSTLFSVVIVLGLTSLALAANSVTFTDGGNKVTATVGHSGNDFTCSGTNQRSNGDSVPLILVSAVCQYRDNLQVWHDFETAPSNSTAGAAVSVTYTDNPCTASDGGADLPAGTWKIRGQADGRYEQPLGTNHPFNGPDQSGIATTATYPVANC